MRFFCEAINREQSSEYVVKASISIIDTELRDDVKELESQWQHYALWLLF